MFSRLRNAFGRLSSTTPSAPESSVEDPIESKAQSTPNDEMVTTRGGRETDSPVVTKTASVKRPSTTKRKIEEEVASPAAAVKRRRNSRSSAQTKQTEEELFREIVEENSHVDLEPAGTLTKMELRDTPKEVTEEDVFHKIEEQAAREVITTEETPHVKRRTTAVVEISPRKTSSRTVMTKVETTTVVDTIEDVDDADVQENSAMEEEEEPQDHTGVTERKGASSQGDAPRKKGPKASKKTKMPLRSKKIDAAHIVPFEDEATPATSNQPSTASEIIEISDDSDNEESVDESEFVTGGVPDSEDENEAELDEADEGSDSDLDEEAEDESEVELDEEAEGVDGLDATEEHVEQNGVNDDGDDNLQSEEEDSDDEAPEAITTSKAQQEVEQAQAAAAEAIEQQATAAKLKRQARDKALKERARKNLKSSKASSSKPADLEPSDDEAEPQDDAEVMDIDTNTETQSLPQPSSIPALLPASLLAATRPSSHSPVPVLDPRLSRAEKKRSRHLKFIEEGTKRTKDVRKGPVSVRVLEEANAFMAPAVDKSSRNVREKWLQGKKETKEVRGKYKPNTSAVRVARKPVGAKGFLRK